MLGRGIVEALSTPPNFDALESRGSASSMRGRNGSDMPGGGGGWLMGGYGASLAPGSGHARPERSGIVITHSSSSQ